ncbi:MAG: hypothetical protein ABR577_12620 [Pyrinomonadaceae bacterium]
MTGTLILRQPTLAKRYRRTRRTTERRARLLIALSLLAFLLQGCGARRTPDLKRIFAEARTQTGKRPLIIVPGILGSELVNRKTGEVVWPSAFRSVDDGLSLPVSPHLAANRDGLVARKIIDAAKVVNTVRFARLVPEVFVYRQLLDALRDYGGYREGDWKNPAEGGDRDTFYVFAYDWRRDNVESARELYRRIEALKQKLNQPDLRFNIVAHSMGGLVARYAAMYGDADLPADGTAPHPSWAGAKHINKIIMLGTPNEGSADSFSALLEGYSVTAGLRTRIPLLNKLTREGALTLPAIFELLPHASATHFLDANLKPVAVDLYDPATWRRYNWSAVTDETFRRKYASGKTGGDDAPFTAGSLDNLDAYFVAVLKRAKHFHEALDATTETDTPVALFAFGGDCEETLDAPVLLRDEKRNRWRTLVAPQSFRAADGRRISRAEAVRAMYVPGDGRVTRRSLLAETLTNERRRTNALFPSSPPLTYAVFACDLHGDLQSNKNLQDNAITLLIGEATK